uniref:Uncharacterized protein n=1 Tax=Setaria italica TaxID=4555 RepID=K3YY34_SETIT
MTPRTVAGGRSGLPAPKEGWPVAAAGALQLHQGIGWERTKGAMIWWPFGEAGAELGPCPMISDDRAARQLTDPVAFPTGDPAIWNCLAAEVAPVRDGFHESGPKHRRSGHCSRLHAPWLRATHYCRFLMPFHIDWPWN